MTELFAKKLATYFFQALLKYVLLITDHYMGARRYYFNFTTVTFRVIQIEQNILFPEVYKTSTNTGVFLKP